MFNKQTTLDLDGPKLGFSTDPQDLTVNAGTAATFVAIGTATFPSNIPAKFATNTGIVTYRWYVDDVAVFDDPDEDDADGVNFLGAGTTTLQIFNNTTTKTVYCEADYIPSAYGLPGVAVTVGSARSTGHAINEPVRSASASLSLNPRLQIDTQPVDRIVAVGVGATFGVDASLTDSSTEGFSYQWQINDSDVSDGELELDVTKTAGAKFTVTSDAGDDFEIDFAEVSSYTFIRPGRTYTLVANGNIETKLTAVGASGGRSLQRSVVGGRGGLASGTFTFVKDQEYKLRIGGAGKNGGGGTGDSEGGFSGGGNGNQTGSGAGGGGGGFTGLFKGSITQDNAILIAAGGGGGANDPAQGGDGGGLIGVDGANHGNNRAGRGGTQTAGGAGGSVNRNGTPGSALQGGPGAGGGGGGYFGGGGGGGHTGCCADGAGGGGSSYIGGVVDGTGATDAGQGRSAQAGDAASAGTFEITVTESAVSVPINLTISGSTTNVLTVSGDAAVSATVKVVVSNSNAFNSPLTSETRTFTSTAARPLIKIEQINNTNTATLLEHDLDDGEITFTDDAYPANQICIYSPERDIEIEMDLFGGKGSDNGANEGGEGGKSTIKFTLDQNVEYIITGLYDEVNAPFIYRKASLIAVVGEGGDAGTNGAGGQGGGVDLGGANGGHVNGGGGGARVALGEMPANGVYGSNTDNVPYEEDQKVPAPNGGRTIKCTKGIYWREQGLSACQDIPSENKFRLSNGTEVQNTSASITRGFKAGYNIIETKGDGRIVGVGGELEGGGTNEGGSGAFGGMGGVTEEGGAGGGSGYSDGSVTIVSTQQGGSTGAAKVVIRLAS